MKVLIVGSGGREHALAWKAMQSPRLSRLYIAPGNAGTARLGENVPVPAEDRAGLVHFARQQAVDLVWIGPEAPLSDGLADALRQAGVLTFGPNQGAAQIEASKAFAKAFMRRHQIPTARYAIFGDYARAAAHLREVSYPIVIKASGLAAGKGVVLPETTEEALAVVYKMLVQGEFGEASREIVIEERLSGPEVSLLAFTDGWTVRPMLPAQDHKRLLDGDCGPNTGGMGAYAPANICPPELVEEALRTILQPTVDGLRQEGRPFSGVLYAGLMLTADGPKVLEFNCRFGDPETQALLPLLESDLLEITAACASGRLAEVEVRWKPLAAACVVLASAGYPGKSPVGRPISGLEAPPGSEFRDSAIFIAGAREEAGRVITAGGRVLAVAAWGKDLPQALDLAYRRVEQVRFEGMQYRKDIGKRTADNGL
jgi:phosphoribosylamine--glycine ligase